MSVRRSMGLFGVLAVGLALSAPVLTAACSASGTDDSSAAAVTGASFDKNNVLDDASLVASDAMSEDEIQSFLEKTPHTGHPRSVLADYKTDSGDLASTVISKAAAKYKINPLVILTRLQMEHGLIGSHGDVAQYQDKIDLACAYACNDDVHNCDDKYLGFENQVMWMARTMQQDMQTLAQGKGTINGWGRNVGKTSADGISVTPKNNATAALYAYTPYVGRGGNTLHFQIWTQYTSAVGFKPNSTGTGTGKSSGPACATDDPQCADTPDASARSAACTTSDSCSGTTPVCDLVTHKCVACRADFAAANAGPLACPGADAPVCGNDGSCGQCSASDDSACVASRDTPGCVVSMGKCGCADKPDLCGAGQYCDTSQGDGAGACVRGCRVQGGADPCPDGQQCSAQDGSTGSCTGQGPGSGSGSGSSCGKTGCSGNLVCDTTSGTCVECTRTDASACSADDKGAACLFNNTCGCATDKDCGDMESGRICDPSSHTCRDGCRGTGGNDCPQGQTCTSGTQSAGTCKTGSYGSSGGYGSSSGGYGSSSGSSGGRKPGSSSSSSSGSGYSSGGYSSGGYSSSGHSPSSGDADAGDPAAAEPDSGSDSKKGCAVSGTGVNGAGEFLALAGIVGAFIGRRRRKQS